MYKSNKISVVIPAYNEENAIEGTIKKIPDFVDEIIVADNNSQDKTIEISKKLGARVVLEKRQGYGYALKAGIEKSLGDIVITIDGDATYPIEDAAEILDYMLENGFDFISGNRLPLENKKAMKLSNIFGTKLLNHISYVLFDLKFKDVLTGMWVFKKDCYNGLTIVSNDWNLSEEIKIEAAKKYKFSEYHINHHVRKGETKLLKWRVGTENLIFLFWKKFFPTKKLPKILKFT